MTDDAAVVCEELSKRYRVTSRDERGKRSKGDFWALRDVSFEIGKGEIVGIVGRNGAGKSTLLKVLSRIVQPTSGRALLRGRLSGLLEVGTGFNPELTGRENVFLNGTMLGMSRRDIQAQFDSIVDFAGISYFLDTPIKRYSSGMYVRLAFAVAAHLQSEIMVLDEVLAVGDAAFQRKCLGKVQDVSRNEGRTVLLVSHNAQVIRQNASSALRLEAGKMVKQGAVELVLEGDEEQSLGFDAEVGNSPRINSSWGHDARIQRVTVANEGCAIFGTELKYRVEFWTSKTLAIGIGQIVTTLDDQPVAASFSDVRVMPSGKYAVSVVLKISQLAPGPYAMHVVVGQNSFTAPDLAYDAVLRVVNFEVQDPEAAIDWRPEWWGYGALPQPEVKYEPMP